MEDIFLKQIELQLFVQHLKQILYNFFQTDSGEGNCYNLLRGETSFSDTKRGPTVQCSNLTVTQY